MDIGEVTSIVQKLIWLGTNLVILIIVLCMVAALIKLLKHVVIGDR